MIIPLGPQPVSPRESQVGVGDTPTTAAAIEYWTILRETVEANQPTGIERDEVLRRWATTWGMVYGIARLNAAGKIPGTVPAERTQLLHDAIEIMREGWQRDYQGSG